MEQFTLQWQPVEPERRIFTVTELNEAVRAMLSNEFQNIWVSGEISGTKTATSGHCYFTLKEADSQISCVSFRSHSALPEVQAAGWRRRSGPRKPGRLRGPRRLPVDRGSLRAAGTRRPAIRLRAVEEEAGRRGPVRRGPQAAHSEISAAHWHGDFTNRRRHRGHAADSRPPFPGPAHPAVPGARAGRRLHRGGLRRAWTTSANPAGQTW